MRRSFQWFPIVSAVLCLGFASGGCGDEGLKGVKSEVKETSAKLDLPDVPTFDMPSPHPDGKHSVREMRLKGRKLFKTEVEIKGFITWIYDCEKELRTGDMTEKDVQKLIEETPDKCNRPHFFIGDTADTLPEKSVWVVEIPRAPRKDERKNFTRKQIKELMDSLPTFALGDEVVVKGTWDETSPGGFSNSDGLLTYKEMVNLTNLPAEDQ